jgi:hypothetical protein
MAKGLKPKMLAKIGVYKCECVSSTPSSCKKWVLGTTLQTKYLHCVAGTL